MVVVVDGDPTMPSTISPISSAFKLNLPSRAFLRASATSSPSKSFCPSKAVVMAVVISVIVGDAGKFDIAVLISLPTP